MKLKKTARKLTVIFRDDTPLIFANDSPKYRTVQIDLTPEQSMKIEANWMGKSDVVDIYEEYSKAILEDIVIY